VRTEIAELRGMETMLVRIESPATLLEKLLAHPNRAMCHLSSFTEAYVHRNFFPLLGISLAVFATAVLLIGRYGRRPTA